MESVKTLLQRYVEEHQAGGAADPLEFVQRARPQDRRELAEQIDLYLTTAPRQPAAGARPDQRSEAAIEELSRSIAGEAGIWPALLPRLRARAGLRRRELVDQLAAALGAADRREKVERYYHEMELGSLPASGVSDRVLDALASLTGTSAAELRRAGSQLGDARGESMPAAAFARLSTGDLSASISPIASGPPTDDEDWDEVDELFRGA